EFFKYMKDLLDENGCGHIKIFGGGGGTILPQEIEELHKYGITKIYSPDDGRRMGLEGMIEDVIKSCDFSVNGDGQYKNAMTLGEVKDVRVVARHISNAENGVGTKNQEPRTKEGIQKKKKEEKIEHEAKSQNQKSPNQQSVQT